MKITIEAEPKDIAVLVREIQERWSVTNIITPESQKGSEGFTGGAAAFSARSYSVPDDCGGAI